MTKQALLDLAIRAEQAEGADRELDALVWCALHGVCYQEHNQAYAAYSAANPETQVEFTLPPKRTVLVTGNAQYPHAKPVSASIDAVLTLVPSGQRRVEFGTYDGSGWAYIHVLSERGEITGESEAATECNALLAAILRAIAADRED